MKKKIATLLVTVAMAGALFAGPALAKDHYYAHDARWWSIHHPAPMYAYNPGYRYSPMIPPPGWHWRFIDGRWRWFRG